PTAHLLYLLGLAKKGEKFTSNTVFDGSSLEGPVEISAFIGKPHEPVGFSNLNRFKEHFGAQKFWPIRFAVYGAQSKGETPDLESAQQMLPNGLPLEYIIDYGDFRIKATLDRYELLGVKCTS
ncbi:MAG: EipB family protein, partial [Alphaproteobacteria bacterium]